MLKWFRSEEQRPAWETVPVKLTDTATDFVAEALKDAGNPASFGGAVTVMRLIERAARENFGPILMDSKINPLSPSALSHLIETGKLDLSRENILKEYEASRKPQN